MGRRFAVIVCALTSAFQRPQAPRAPRHIARPTRVASLPPTPEDAEDEVSWRRSVTSADFDDALVYRLFRRQFEILLPGFVPKKQLAVSARRGKASLRRLRLNATALNRLFNPLAVDEGFPLQLLRCVCDSVSIAWTSVFTLNRDPLEVRINKIEFEFDQEARRPTKYQLGEAKREWDALAPAPAAFMNEYPTIEGARFLVDELVCVARRVEAPFPRGGNSTVRLTLRGVDARSVDNASAVADLRRCWASYNPAPNAAAAFIAKRVVAREALVEIKFDDHEAAPDAPEAAASAAATAAAADATAPEVAEDVSSLDFERGDPTESDLDDLFPREETTPDRLWLLRRRREAAGGAANWSVTRTSDDWEPPRVEFSKNSEDDGFVVLARAPAPAALLTVGYDSPRAEVKSIRVDLDLRRFRLALDSDLLGDEGPAKPGDVSLGVFALFGDSRPAALRPAPSKVGAVGDALSAVLNRIVRPAAALLVLAWGARLI